MLSLTIFLTVSIFAPCAFSQEIFRCINLFNHEDPQPVFTQEERESLDWYSSASGYGVINSVLRKFRAFLPDTAFIKFL